MLRRQQHLEALYGTNVRELSPVQLQTQVHRSTNRQQIDEIAAFNTYLKNLPNIEFKKQLPKDKNFEKLMTHDVHFKRFENFDNFPAIFSNNTK